MSDREGPQSRTTEHDKFQQGGMNYSSPPLESAGEEYSDSERPVKRSRSGKRLYFSFKNKILKAQRGGRPPPLVSEETSSKIRKKLVFQSES